MNGPWLDLGAQVALGWAAMVASVSVTAIHRARGRARRALAPVPAVPKGTRVLLVRPCAGDEPGLERHLASLARAHRSFAVRCRIAIAEATDPALPAAERAAAALVAQGIDARVVLTAARGPNRKVSQVHHVVACEEAPVDALIVADSDLDLDGADLDRLIAPLTGPSPRAAVWAPPAEHGPATAAGDRASAALLGASLHAFPLLAGLDREGMVGKLFAVRAPVLAAVGGFGALAAHLGEDMELGRRIRADGGVIEAAPFLARSMASGRGLDAAVARFTRWILVIRAQRPWLLPSYPALFFATPLIVALALITAPASPRVALAAALLALTSRLAVALAASRAVGRPLGLVAASRAAVLGDALLARAFVGALASRRVAWRGAALVLDRAGLLRERG